METKAMRTTSERIHALFRAGVDTYDISQALDLSEPEVCMALHRLRCRALGVTVRTQASRCRVIGGRSWWRQWFHKQGLILDDQLIAHRQA
jgi:hypothetical protein